MKHKRNRNEQFQVIDKREFNFAFVPNEILEDPKLSWGAKAIIAYLYSNTERRLSEYDLLKISPCDSSGTMVDLWSELQNAGYMGTDGKIGVFDGVKL